MKTKTPFFFLLLLQAFSLLAQDEDYFTEDHLHYEDWTYQPSIKTVQLYRDGFELSAPVLQLASGDKLRLRFDDLAHDYKDYSYTFIHCDADWKPSNLVKSEYLHGFLDAQITNYAFSFNTIQEYVHYTVAFPNDDVRFTKSGNYLLVVYKSYDDKKVVLTRRFMVFENLVTINASVRRSTIVDDRQTKQEVDFTIDHSGYEIDNPFNDVKVVIRQNDRWDNAITGLKPMFVKTDLLTYDYDYDNTFNAGNEFREFDTRSLRYQSQYVDDITYDSLHNHVYLKPLEKRAFKRYLSEKDIDGRFSIQIQDGGTDPYTEGDYAFVHFELPYPQALDDANVYVFGALSDWQCKKDFKMVYNEDRRSYLLAVYLKQGFYNYNYAVLNDSSNVADLTAMEGSHWETENNYTIMVYHRPVGQYYDKLVGLSTVSSSY